MKKILHIILATLVVCALGLYAAHALAATEELMRCSNVLISDLHPNQHDPFHYDHDCVMEQNPNYVAPTEEINPPAAQSAGPTGSATCNASPQPVPNDSGCGAAELPATHPSALTANQVAAIIGLLEAFGVDPQVVGQVAVILYGKQ